MILVTFTAFFVSLTFQLLFSFEHALRLFHIVLLVEVDECPCTVYDDHCILEFRVISKLRRIFIASPMGECLVSL